MTPTDPSNGFSDRPVTTVLSDMSSGRLPAAGGFAAALTAAQAAALVAMIAQSELAGWESRGAATAQAAVLSRRLGQLAKEDMCAFSEARELLDAATRSTRDLHGQAATRNQRLADALYAAAAAPAAIAEAAADVAGLAAWAAQSAPAATRPDALVAVHLAYAAAEAASVLVAANLGEQPQSALSQRAAAALRAARHSHTDASAQAAG